MPGNTGASPFTRSRVVKLSRNSSLTWRVRKRSSEKILRRNSPSVRGRLLMKGTPTKLQWPDYTPCGVSVFRANPAPDRRQAIIGHFTIRKSRIGSHVIARACLICLVMRPALCQTAQPPLHAMGQIVDVTCEGDPTQSYALY